MSEDCLLEGQLGGGEEFGPEDDLDAFNDETFGGGGLGEEWKEDAHEELAMMTEQERQAMKQSQDFFNFGSDGEELGGELEDAPAENGGDTGHDNMVQRMDQLSLQGGAPPPLTVQTSVANNMIHHQPVPPQHYPGHPQQHPQQQQMIYHHQIPQQQQQQPMGQFPLLPPSHFAGQQHAPGAGPVQYQDPAIMSLSKMPPQPQFMHGQQQPQYMLGQPPQQQFPHQQPPQQRPPAFSPPTVPGMKTLADIENEMMFGAPRPGPPQQQQQQQGGPMMLDRGGHVGHINPALHNLNYPGMRDRHIQQHPQRQQQPPQQPQQPQQQQQYRQSPVLSNQQQLQQGLQQQVRHNNQQQQFNNRQHHQQRNNNYNHQEGGHRRRNDNNYYNQQNDYYGGRDHDNNQRRQRYKDNDPNRRNEETFGATAVKEQELKEFGDQSVTRRDLMPGHVHTLGILRHSRSRHDRHNHETFGEEESEMMAANPTGDPLLDARMAEEEEEMARRRRNYANSEDEYAGLMSQKDKQWIINIQLNQLKCDNPYVDDYYFTMYQARKEEQKFKEDAKAGNHLLLNESVVELPPSYTPAQFENSLGKLQCVTVKAPRQIIDVGVMRHNNESPNMSSEASSMSPAPGAVVLTDKKHAAGEYKALLMRIEVLFAALLDLEADKLKLNALPTGAPLREQITNDEETHLQILQSGLSNNDAISDCLAVAKGRNLVLRSLAYLSNSPFIVTNILNSILANIHHVARNDQQDLQFWTLLAKHIDTESLDNLEPAASNLLSLKNKIKKAVVSTSLGSTIMLTLILKASLESGKSNNNLNTWTQLTQYLLNSVAEGAKLGAFLVKFNLAETTLSNLVNLDNKLKPAWLNIMELSRGVEVSS